MRYAVSSDAFALPGADLVYEVDGTGPAVVLVHGFGLDLRMWQPQVEPLTDGFQVVRYNCRGSAVREPSIRRFPTPTRAICSRSSTTSRLPTRRSSACRSVVASR